MCSPCATHTIQAHCHAVTQSIRMPKNLIGPDSVTKYMYVTLGRSHKADEIDEVIRQ